MDNYTLLVLVLIVPFAMLVWRDQSRHRDTIRGQRRAMWDRCLVLFEQVEVSQDDVNFPVLKGFYNGRRVTLEPIADHIAYRKLPQLWLHATIYTRLPVRGTFDYLVRPENIEFYSSVWSLPVTVPIPESWPQHALLRTDADARMPSLELISPHMKMFDDTKLKELVITPNGARTVYQLNQGQRAHYAVFRGPQFDALQVGPETVETLLGQTLALVADLERAE